MKRGSRRRLGFLGFALVTVCGAPTLADETHDPFWMVASSTSSDAILPGVARSRDDREGLCRLPDADNRPADSDCGGHVAGDRSATLSGEVAREVVRQARFGDWSGLMQEITDAWPTASATGDSRPVANDIDPEAWRDHPNPAAVSVSGWEAQLAAIPDVSSVDAGRSSLHAGAGGAAAGLFETFAIAGKKLLLLILVGPFLALRAALWRRGGDEVRDNPPARLAPTRRERHADRRAQ